MKIKGMCVKMPQVFDIQKYSIHDGDGIRTSIFFQGCPLRCAWCHNPESQQKKPQLLWNREKCTGCGWCAGVCPQKAITMEQGVPVLDRDACIGCGKCVMECLESARAVSGERKSVRELLEAGEKDRVFYEESGGGVTLSGGEVMTAEPFEEVVELCRGFFEKGISVFIDTSGFASWERFESILPYVTAFLYDIKAVNPETHQKWIGVDNRLILENLGKLSAAGADIRLRLPLVSGINDSREEIEAVLQLLQSGIHVRKIHLLPYHDIGKNKYARLGRSYDEAALAPPTPEHLEELAEILRQTGVPVVIGG